MKVNCEAMFFMYISKTRCENYFLMLFKMKCLMNKL